MRILLIVILLLVSNSTAREANSAYRQGDYEKAVELYNQAIADDPENAKLYFNLGNALAKAGQLQDALVAYDAFKQRAQTDEEKALADYSIGNTMGQMNDWGSAANFFKNALVQNPDDPDARHNYELALKKKQEQEKQQQKQDQNKDQNKDQKQDQQQQQNQDQKQDEKKDDQKQQPQDQQKPQQDQQQKQQPKPEEIDKKQAEKILEALENKEEDLLKQLKKKKAPNKDNPKKDW